MAPLQTREQTENLPGSLQCTLCWENWKVRKFLLERCRRCRAQSHGLALPWWLYQNNFAIIILKYFLCLFELGASLCSQPAVIPPEPSEGWVPFSCPGSASSLHWATHWKFKIHMHFNLSYLAVKNMSPGLLSRDKPLGWVRRRIQVGQSPAGTGISPDNRGVFLHDN